MFVTHLSLADFRSYERAEVQLEAGVTVFTGANGQGKTNLVEAIEFLATLGSHRVATEAPLVRAGAERSLVRARVQAGLDDPRSLLLELEVIPGRANKASLNRSPLRRPRDLLGALRVVLFSPEDLAIVKGDPSERRRFIDELVVARWPRLAGVRADYDRVLRQRSTLLKSLSGRGPRAVSEDVAATLDVWDGQLAGFGAEIVAARLVTLTELRPHLVAAYADIAPTNNVAAVEYKSSSLEPPTGTPASTVIRPSSSVVSSPSSVVSSSSSVVPSPSSVVSSSSSVVPSPSSVDLSPSSVIPSPSYVIPANAGIPDTGLATQEPEIPGQARDDVRAAGDAAAAVPSVAEITAMLTAAMQARRGEEIARGLSLVGPHRDDLTLTLGALPTKGYASHGESWSTALALRLASFALLRADGVEPLLILDDVFAELDETRRERLADLVAGAEQVLITAAVAADVPARLAGRRFSVHAGEVSLVEQPTVPTESSRASSERVAEGRDEH